MEDAGEGPLEDALLFALDDLRGDNFKRFKNQLCFLKVEGKPPIPWAKLQGADPVDTVHLMRQAYGQEGAQDMAIKALKAVGLQGSASRLQKRKRNDCREKYKQHIQETFRSQWEQPLHPGTAVSLRQSYTDLLTTRSPHLKEKTHERVTLEWKHPQGEAHPEDLLEVGLGSLFGPDAQGQSSRTTVLLGPAGVGKTTAVWKAMLDWASGRLWQERFEYVFYIPGGVVNRRGGDQVSAADLLLGHCPPRALPAEDIFANQDAILVIVDGFDELEQPGLLPGEALSSDLHKKQAPENLVRGLLGKKLLTRSHLLVTSQPTALRSLQLSLKSPRFLEVLGFSPTQQKEYFDRFFGNQEEAAQAFEAVQRNESLSGLCFLPVACWILCSLVRQKPQSFLLKGIPEMATFTEIHMLLLFSFLEGCSRPKNIEALCSLARDGVLHGKMVFDLEVLEAHGLGGPDLDALSSFGCVLHQDIFGGATYKFSLLSFQEFFAALSFILVKDGDSVPSPAALNQVLGNRKELRHDHFLLVRFLFGLSSARRLRALQTTWGFQASRRALVQELSRWVEEEAKRHSFGKRERLLELCHCVYEGEDAGFAKSVMGQVPHLDLEDQLSTKLDFAALSFGLLASQASHSLWLSGYPLGPAELEQLLPGLLRSSEIHLNRCRLSPASCETLASVVEGNRGLTTLDLGENPLHDLGVTRLCDRLIDSGSQLQSLRLPSCQLTAAACESLSQLLATSLCLTEMDLGENRLGDLGLHRLYEGLKHPQTRLQRLTLHSCGLTGAACEDLASILESCKALVDLGLGENQLGDEGVRRLIVALKRPSCKLRRLALTMKFFSQTTKKRLQAACAAQPQLHLSSYYPPGFPAFPGEDSEAAFMYPANHSMACRQ